MQYHKHCLVYVVTYDVPTKVTAMVSFQLRLYCYSSTVSHVAKDYRSHGYSLCHVVYTCHKRLMRAIEMCRLLCSHITVIFATQMSFWSSLLLYKLSMCTSDTNGFFRPQPVVYVKGYTCRPVASCVKVVRPIFNELL